EEFDLAGVLRPAFTQYLDGDDLAGPRVVRPIHAAEAPGGDAVEHAESAEEITVCVPFDELGPLPGRQVALALQGAEEGVGRASSIPHFRPSVGRLVVGNEVKTPGELGNPSGVGGGHATTANETGTMRPGYIFIRLAGAGQSFNRRKAPNGESPMKAG